MENDYIICQSGIAMRVKDIVAIVPKKETITGDTETDFWELHACMSNGHVLLMTRHIQGSELQNAVISSAYAVKQTNDSYPDVDTECEESCDIDEDDESVDNDLFVSATPSFLEPTQPRSRVFAESE